MSGRKESNSQKEDRSRSRKGKSFSREKVHICDEEEIEIMNEAYEAEKQERINRKLKEEGKNEDDQTEETCKNVAAKVEKIKLTEKIEKKDKPAQPNPTPTASTMSDEERQRALEKLAEVRKRREEMQNMKALAVTVAQSQASQEDEDNDEELEILSSIEIKKMNGATLKEHLKKRGLSIQGQNKELMKRLQEYEDDRKKK